MAALRSVSELALLAVVVLQMVGVCSANYLYFYYPNFTNTQYLTLQNNASQSGSLVWLLQDPDPSWRTTNPNDVKPWTGWMTFDYAFSLAQQTQFQSFNTSFTFLLVTPGAESDCPSGMAFFMTTYHDAPASPSNRYFGLSATDPAFFAVEFDTRMSTYTTDPSGSHVGIDIGSVNSTAYVDTSSNNPSYYPQLYLYNNTGFKVWISYNSPTQVIKVWMTNDITTYSAYLNPPGASVLLPILEYNYDLSNLFSTSSNQYVGFTSATQSDSSMLGVALGSWYFSFDNGSSSTVPPPPSSGATPSPPPPSSSATPSPPSSSAPNPPPPPPRSINSNPAPPPPPPRSSKKATPSPPPPPSTPDNGDNPLLRSGAGHSYIRGSSNGFYAMLSIVVGLIIGRLIG